METTMNQDTTVTNENTSTVSAETPTAPVAEVATPAPKKEKAVKTQKFVIYQDKDGTELRRVPSHRGRPPLGSTLDEQGNRIVKNATLATDGTPQLANATVAKTDVFYITVDDEGQEVSREKKSRGRTKKGFVQHEQGEFAENWVGKALPKTPATPSTIEKEVVQTTEVTSSTHETVEAPLMNGIEDCSGVCPSMSA